MKPHARLLSLLLTGTVGAVLYGCSGGGGGASSSQAPMTISGTAASGAVFEGATIYIYDSRGVQVGSTTDIDPVTGAYNLTLQADAVTPMVAIAARSSADGQTETMVSVIGSPTQTTVNITPVTSLLASLLSPSGDPNKLLDELTSGTARITPESIVAAVNEINRILSSVITATGTTSTDPLTTDFVADGTSYDRLLDSITVSFTPASNSSTNIEIGVKATSTDDAQPVMTSFSSSDTTKIALASVDSATLVAPGTSTLIAAFLAQLNSCYALPLASRILPDGTTAADIVAAECRGAFWGNDPALFLSNGAIVAKGGAFNSMFVSGGTGVVFSQGTYEFTRPNGDIVAGYKSRDLAGNETYDTFALRKDESDGKLKLVGNRYPYPGGVAAYHQLRQFVTLGQSASSYYSSGYNLSINDVVVGGNSIFDRVVVTTPKDTQLVLKPSAGSSFLILEGAAGSTSFVRLARAYVDTSKAAEDPQDADTRMFFSPIRYDDEAIQKIPAQSVWKFEYYLKTDTATPASIQYYKTRARAMTLAELRTVGFPSLTTDILAGIAASADGVTGTLIMSENDRLDVIGPSGADGWTVTSGQLPPTQITAFGRYGSSPGLSFNDTAKFGSTTRKTNVPCTRSGAGDNHCHDNLNGTYGPGYKQGAAINGLHLWARDVTGREFANFYAAYKLTSP